MPRKPIRYARQDLTDIRGGFTRHERGRLAEEDNPSSPHFIPLKGRGSRDQARWWAKMGRRKRRTVTGEF